MQGKQGALEMNQAAEGQINTVVVREERDVNARPVAFTQERQNQPLLLKCWTRRGFILFIFGVSVFLQRSLLKILKILCSFRSN